MPIYSNIQYIIDKLYLIINYLTANAIGTYQQITYLLKGLKVPVKKYCIHIIEEGVLINVNVDNQSYFALPTVHNLLKRKFGYFSLPLYGAVRFPEEWM